MKKSWPLWQIKLILIPGDMNFTRKLAVKHPAKPGKWNVLNFPGDGHLAENRCFWNLEFFNKIGQQQSFEQPNVGHEFASFIKVIASIEDPVVMSKILAHLDDNATSAVTTLLPDCRASPAVDLFVLKNKPSHSPDPLFLTCSSIASFTQSLEMAWNSAIKEQNPVFTTQLARQTWLVW